MLAGVNVSDISINLQSDSCVVLLSYSPYYFYKLAPLLSMRSTINKSVAMYLCTRITV